MRENDLAGSAVYACGGGSVKFGDLFAREFGDKGIKVHNTREYHSLVAGFNFVRNHVNEPSFTVDSSTLQPTPAVVDPLDKQ